MDMVKATYPDIRTGRSLISCLISGKEEVLEGVSFGVYGEHCPRVSLARNEDMVLLMEGMDTAEAEEFYVVEADRYQPRQLAAMICVLFDRTHN